MNMMISYQELVRTFPKTGAVVAPTLKLAIVKTPAANDLRKKLIIPVPYSVLISGC
ncbi:hypothetical protein [Klebsiella pneumoniae]|nr:hypothetical protein [Klebsiella pneumoniae]